MNWYPGPLFDIAIIIADLHSLQSMPLRIEKCKIKTLSLLSTLDWIDYTSDVNYLMTNYDSNCDGQVNLNFADKSFFVFGT